MLKELVFGSPTKKSIRRDGYKACFEVNSINAEKRRGLLESVVESFVIRFSQNLRIACFLLGNDFRLDDTKDWKILTYQKKFWKVISTSSQPKNNIFHGKNG